MSWRKFLVLLRGLSREAVFVIVNTDQTSDGTQIVDGESDEASSIVKSFFG